MKSIYIVLFFTVLSLTGTNDRKTITENTINFIAGQKEVIKQEEAILVKKYEQAKQALSASDSGVNQIVNQIETIVVLILESQEFANYNDYMTDFQTSLIATGGLRAEELPSLNPDKTLFIKINEIFSENWTLRTMITPEITTFFTALLTLEANKVGTQNLLEKLATKQQQLIAELKALDTIN